METIYNLNLDYIFIDVISMVKKSFYQLFSMVKWIKPDIKFIIAGNYNQLAPSDDRI